MKGWAQREEMKGKGSFSATRSFCELSCENSYVVACSCRQELC